ncbi:MAG TPA: DNA adenine methylase, partial [Panacibacter sp.]|nr:DNA adenine methylase [Panacibacter sp.]
MKTKSFLRWAGSKQKLIPELKKYWDPKFNRYMEPFMGSAKLFFSVDVEEAVLSDSNNELVETFLQVQKNPYPIYKILKTLKVSIK